MPDLPHNHLTEREKEVAVLIAQGTRNAHVAAMLSISEETVKRHLGNIFAKLKLSTRLELALWVARGPIEAKGNLFRVYPDGIRWTIDRGARSSAVSVGRVVIGLGCISRSETCESLTFLRVTAQGYSIGDDGAATFY